MNPLGTTPGSDALCEHSPSEPATPRTNSCEECGSGFNLRSCAQCGHVGCCESQAGHAPAHALSEDHPVIEQMTGAGLGFAWCYTENAYVR
ncbi:MAG TPA: UBP-type zinc finger domain-containing protein [Candidatus Limnocylindria bacterium]|nr:UBP-type zinc finger domain-containing protein [Candidatus Limnocylindria bacterium]